ncbi:MAG: hypothetical protein KME64_25215 [Scytonematopsis contorta HA4267-MV1]|nr:hypothetical protein [Scytonematopsis contorta HA4267-MV1]
MQEKLNQVEIDLQEAKTLIRAMESSKFWKLRTQWFKVRAQVSKMRKNIGLIQQEKTSKTTLPYYESDPTGAYLTGMTSADDQYYMEQYAKEDYTGEGEILDLGCFLGSFSVSLAKGLDKNFQLREKKERIHTYDIFIWDKYIAEILDGNPLAAKLQVGDCFLDAYLKVIAPWQDKIKVNKADLTQTKWSGGKIEFIAIDAMKSWELTNSIIKNFFPYLIPGLSLVHHQDFGYYWTTWIHLSMYVMRDYFEPIYHIPADSIVFKYKKSLPEEVVNISYGMDYFSRNDIDAAFEYSMSYVPEYMRAKIAAAKVAYYIQFNDNYQDRVEIEDFKRRGIYQEKTPLFEVEKLLNTLHH